MDNSINIITPLYMTETYRDEDTSEIMFIILEADIKIDGQRIETYVEDERTNHFVVTLYDYGDGELVFGDEQTRYTLDGEDYMDYSELPEELRSIIEKRGLALFKSITA